MKVCDSKCSEKSINDTSKAWKKDMIVHEVNKSVNAGAKHEGNWLW